MARSRERKGSMFLLGKGFSYGWYREHNQNSKHKFLVDAPTITITAQSPVDTKTYWQQQLYDTIRTFLQHINCQTPENKLRRRK